MTDIEPPIIHRAGGRGFDSNIYVLDGDSPVIVDAGTGGVTYKYILEIKEALEYRRAGRLVLTHRHVDHSGGAHDMVNELGVEVLIHEEGVNAVTTGDSQETGAWLFGTPFKPVDASPLKEGDVIDVGGAVYEVLHTPGHSPDQIALWEPGSRTVIPGDTVYADGGIGRWDLKGGDYDQLVASIERILGLEPEVMHSGHGPSVRSGAAEHVRMGLRSARMYGGLG